ncbi:response regulator transcription factor [Crassaminicella thermophila]|uniref:Stage 0 sporulation protein A homolog n=1 Tax=Crassaminicella thermophila TaxID=2599308 RepID=A0A5C0SF05_CRATE|nr:response regulator transcription factor [Crassaminicella thermophila]QEK11884.1 response regulator transcription factor [Crassaminicella thermophila]
MKHKILIVEDENSIRSLLKITFKNSGYSIIETACGEEGIEKAKLEKPHVAILDVMLPGIDGFAVCEVLRKEFPQMGIIMLTARGQDLDKISGLKLGADDYVIKPFNPIELVLRVQALLRRIDDMKSKKETIIESYPFKIDTTAHIVYKQDKVIEMTPKEYLLMKIFVENKGKAFTRDELLDLVWGWDFIGDTKIVDVNIRRLRRKIEDDASKPIFIETVWGVGYRWRKPGEKYEKYKKKVND